MKQMKEEFIEEEGSDFPGKTYMNCVLKHVFEFQREHLLYDMFMVHRAHIIMLIEEKIISLQEGKEILTAVEKVAQIPKDELHYNSKYEDLFFLIEHFIIKEANDNTISNMHIGRSRNDMGVTMYRLSLRRYLLRFMEHFMLLQESILQVAHNHIDTIMPAYTHTQPAQPTTFGHYMVAVYDVMGRDLERIWKTYHFLNNSPMGAAALSTTSFLINRKRVAELLGFSSVIENSYDAVAGADYLLEVSSLLMVTMTNMGRWIHDFLLLATKEYNGITVANPYVQISSIMPQKRNPVSIEHARALTSSAIGEAFTVFQMIHNTPFGDIVDTEDDLQPYLYEGMEKAIRVFCTMNAVVRTMKVEEKVLKDRSFQHAITITDLADTLTKNYHIPFRLAHHAASEVAKMSLEQSKELHELELGEINVYLQKRFKIKLSKEEWENSILPEMFVKKRIVYGGPSHQEMERMILKRRAAFEQAEKNFEREKQRISKVEKETMQLVTDMIRL
ncbi:argininosuccinate lyase [Bacillus cytotoxicus]|uniref:Argininosuccinate lyase n=1 Tax=Bacillus cytotoxicus (strain DSM 22905 / CIP 110041 / 391-98 / NVH 391-98) TaxID=315749 RepID=A7GQR6_BACCN|nr:argininosuccinate lyase [Bacillus cytotoxicus]ABS22474.1 argininosuccinate lyase [Bacillus cytotoxicus NVH 391-98]AWC45127.1 argininosuccinate lyase [Bacillus cytotoxicus]MDH2865432.1 argininosuccinate lyase [Bacillus cytotoxicus]MDH2882548.1 argininosuccinate lyase [Bacillus cytotoxicus]MDH2885331.1 argininosuccinate lyase [Bacillus cytotoxicus]